MTADRPTPDAALDAELRALFADEPADGEPLGSHLDLVSAPAYLAGELDADERERVALHLENCRCCAEMVLDLDTLRAEASDDPEVADLEIAAAWRAMRPRLGSKPEASRPLSRRPWAAALAALFALVALGLGWRVAQLERAPGVQPNVPIAYLDPVRAGEVTVEAPASGVLLLVVTPSSAPDPVAHRLDLATVDGEQILWIDGLKATDLGTFRVAVPTGVLPPGGYHVRLVPSNDPAGPATEYRLRVESHDE